MTVPSLSHLRRANDLTHMFGHLTFLLDSVSRAACLPERGSRRVYAECLPISLAGISSCRASCMSVFCFRNQAR